MPRLSKVDIIRKKALNTLNNLQNKVDGRSYTALMNKFNKSTSENKINAFIKEIDAIKNVYLTEKALVNQEGVSKKTVKISSKQVNLIKNQIKKQTKQQKEEQVVLNSTIPIIPDFKEMTSLLYKTLKSYKGKSVIIKYIVDGIAHIDTEVHITNNFSSWWEDNIYLFWVKSGQYRWELYHYAGDLFIYPASNVLVTSIINQSFKEGITNCLFTPIISWINNKIDTVLTKKTQQNYKCLLKKAIKLNNKFFDS